MDVYGLSGFSTPAGLASHREVCAGPPDLRQVVGMSLKCKAHLPQLISLHLPQGLTPAVSQTISQSFGSLALRLD